MATTEGYAVTDRNGIVENRHQIHAAVVDMTGKLMFAVGDPERVTLVRSAAKPAQALAVLETGGFVQFGFDEADLALMCASHSSEPAHVDRARAMLAKVGSDETLLHCGGHSSLNETLNRQWIKDDFAPTAIHNNCSGKHAGMLGGTRALGAELDTYHLPSNPMQVRFKLLFQELCGLPANDIQWAVDGCNLPAPAVPLHKMARVYAGFANAVPAHEEVGTSLETRIVLQARIFRAMTLYPEMVGGEDRFCTKLMQSFDGGLIGKLGADGFYAIGILPSEDTRRLGAQGAVGIAIKIEDGNIEILYAVVMEILEQLQIGTPEMRRQLEAFHRIRRYNTAGIITGQVTMAFRIHAQ